MNGVYWRPGNQPLRDLQEFYGGAKKADWDVGIVVDAIRTSPGLDVIVLCSGDGDFISLAEYLKNQGKRIEVMAFGKTTSGKLIEAADEFIDLDDSDKYLLNIKYYQIEFYSLIRLKVIRDLYNLYTLFLLV